jgi:type III secretion regulatory protein HpaA
MSTSRIGPAHVPTDNATASQSTSGVPATPGHHRHHEQEKARKSANRARAKRRRGADSQDGVDESGASEELLQMLEEHLQRNAEIVMRAGERRGGEQGNPGSGQQDDDERGMAGEALPGRRSRVSRSSTATGDVSEAHRSAEQALLAARRSQATVRPPASSTYEVLTAMREFLMLPGAAARSSTTLAAVRARLIEAAGVPSARAPVRQHSINLLLPLMLLNLERVRTGDERALAIAKINSLLGRRRAGV